MKTVQKVSIGAIAGTVAALVGIWTALDPWPSVGWITPNQHQADITGLRADLDTYKAQTASDTKEFRDEWKCDEYDEELKALRRRLNKAEEGTDLWADLKHDIQKIETKMEKLECSRFEDFG